MPLIKNKILQFIESQGMSIREFERKCGLSNGYLKKIQDISPRVFYNKILPVFPDIRIVPEFDFIPADLHKTIDPRALEIVEAVLNHGAELNNRVSPARPRVESKPNTRPRIPVTVTAGTLSELLERTTENDFEQIPVVHQLPGYDFTMIIKGDSMEPVYQSGDEVACKRIDEKRFVQWGKPHILDTTQGIILKRVYEEVNHIRCVSYNKEYPDILIPKEDIRNMFLVVGSIRITEM